jgi:hypothetical protein
MASLPSVIHPIGAYTLYGLVWQAEYAIALDAYQGHLLKIDPATEGASILNFYNSKLFTDGTGIAITGETLWLVQGNTVYYCAIADFDLQPFIQLPEQIHGIAVSDGAVYVSSPQVNKIFVFGRATRGWGLVGM